MNLKIILNSRVCSNGCSAVKHNTLTTISLFRQYLPAIQVTKLLLILLLFCPACGNKKGQAGKEQTKEQPDIKFDKATWNAENNGNYTHRKQMVKDILDHYQWTGVKKDSVVQMLGQPDDIDEGNLMYNYEKKPFLGGFGTTIEAIVFELTPDSTVKVAKLNDGGWD